MALVPSQPFFVESLGKNSDNRRFEPAKTFPIIGSCSDKGVSGTNYHLLQITSRWLKILSAFRFAMAEGMLSLS
jgi:hypothetical protein